MPILGFTKDAKDPYLSASGYYDDKTTKTLSSKFNEDESKLIRPDTVTKDGAGKSIELIGKLHLDLAFQPKALLGGTNLKIPLMPNDPKFYLNLSDASGIVPSVEFEDACLFLHITKAHPVVVEAHNSALEKGTAKYPICRAHVRAFNINKDVIDTTIDNAITGQLPRRIFIALVPNTGFTGDYLVNPYVFKHYNLNYLAAYVDGVQYPAKAYKPNFATKQYSREYLGLFESL